MPDFHSTFGYHCCHVQGKMGYVKKQFPKWDLALVLEALTKLPFKPLVSASLKSLTLHDLIKRCGTPALFEEWRKARWEKTYSEDWLPIKNRRK